MSNKLITSIIILICISCMNCSDLQVTTIQANCESEVIKNIVLNACIKDDDIVNYGTLKEFLSEGENGVCYKEGHIIALRLNKTKFNDVSLLVPLKYLVSLQLMGNNIEKIDGLEKLGELRELNLHKNYITTIGKLNLLGKLQYIDLSLNRLSGNICVGSFKALRTILVYNNDIESIDLMGGYNLRWIMARNNKIARIDNIQYAERLHILDLYNNPIYEICNIDLIKKLKIIYIGSMNVLDYDKFNKFVAKLKKEGKTVVTSPDIDIEPDPVDYEVQFN